MSRLPLKCLLHINLCVCVQFDNFVFNRENEELRERIQFLESVISGEQDDLLECMKTVFIIKITPEARDVSLRSDFFVLALK